MPIKKGKRKCLLKTGPFQMPADTRFWYKHQYIHCINETAPEVSDALTDLTPMCTELFGDFAAIAAGDKNIWQADLWRCINRRFEDCVWAETRGIYSDSDTSVLEKSQKIGQFQESFDNLVRRFCFEKAWLGESVFRAIWDGTGQLQIYFGVDDNLGFALINDLRRAIGRQEWKPEEKIIVGSEPSSPCVNPSMTTRRELKQRTENSLMNTWQK